MKARWTVRDRQNTVLIAEDGRCMDPIFSRHHTEGAARKVVEDAHRRAKKRLGPTGYSQLYVREETARLMTTIHLAIERDRECRSAYDGARFRVKCYAQPGGPALLVSTRALQSVAKAKSETAALFGDLDWSDSQAGDVRCTAVIEIE